MDTTLNYENALLQSRVHHRPGEFYNNNYVVFIVEDNMTSRVLLERYLKRLPNSNHKSKPHLEIYDFESAEECLKSELKPDIVIIDHYLNANPDDSMNGLELMRRLKKMYRKAKYIIMSVQDNVMLTATYYDEGAYAYIAKSHACTARIEQTILKIIREDQKAQRRRKRLAWLFIVIFLSAVIGFLITL